ncbi:DoxX family membrane protein [Streptomyces sp. NPDC006997]|uniref:DoxX family protein n=1 Tax=Streptomyces sp. NPDC006997 TaxID=3155356 RepID=UPI0033FED3CB
MSVDTRTPRTPTGDPSGFDDAPALSMVKVPSDPAQVIVNHASFRVQLGASSRPPQLPRIARHASATEGTARMPAVGASTGARRRPVVWSGRSLPDDSGAHRLLQAVRGAGVRPADESDAGAAATQVIPRVDPQDGYDAGYGYGDGLDDGLVQTVEAPVVGAQRGPGDATRLLPHMRTVASADDEAAQERAAYAPRPHADDGPGTADDPPEGPAPRRHGDDPARHAYYPGRRMNLGVVLLPLRVFLGFISIYAGMGKLCDPVYFDGGKRGSMVKWLNTLHPWEVAEPLRQFALEHPVGSGLVIAFFQVIVGVLTVLGCWQRVAAVLGALLSAALLVTVSWKSVPAYDTPDIIYLAAWSPLIIAGAPVYSVDGRLASGAWRRLGPRADIWELRLYVLRRGALVTAIATGLTLLIGSLLGSAVRDADRVVVPGPGEAPRNELPGSPLPQDPEGRRTSPSASASSPTQGATQGASSAPPTAGAAASPGATRDTGAVTGGAPSQTQGTAGQAPPRQTSPGQQAPSTSAGPTSGGAATSGGDPTGGTGAGTGSGGGAGGGDATSGQPGLVGGLLG